MFPRLAVVLRLSFLVGVVARPSGSVGRPAVHVVQPSDTLWSIATAHYAGDPREGIWKLRERNGLDGTTIVPGQRLVVP